MFHFKKNKPKKSNKSHFSSKFIEFIMKKQDQTQITGFFFTKNSSPGVFFLSFRSAKFAKF